MLLRISIVLISLFTSAYSQAQQSYLLEIRSFDNTEIFKKIDYKKIFTTKILLDKELERVLFVCYDNAYLTANYDSVFTDTLKKTTFAYIHLGAEYKWAYLKKGNVDEGVLSEIGFREKLYSNKPVNFKDVKRIHEKIITYYENNGYPFASVSLDSIQIYENSISAQLHLQKNAEQKIDSVIIKGNAKVASVYLYNYLGVKPGVLYDESQLKKVNTRIAELPFIKATQSAEVKFTNKHNKLVLHIDKKRASQFDGIVGVLPDNVTGKLLFTGDVRLKLQNGLNRGELIDINWRRLQTQTQDLKARLVYPFVLRTPFGLDYNFKLYKRDTTFIDVYQNIGVQYLLIGGNYFKVFYNNKTSNLLSTKGLEFVTTLPPYADIKTDMYGLGWRFEKLDYRLNPRKGFTVTANGSVGTKKIKKNAKINQEVYDDLDLNTAIYNADIEAALFIPFFNRHTFKVANQSAFIQGKSIFQNELYRIGGLKTLRGFDEESIFASTYSIFTLEYRFLLEQNSYMYVFGDGAWYENNNVKNFVTDTPIGFGAGISFETKAGIFSINYALGKQFDNPIQLRSGKIHFGIVNYF